MIKLHIMAAEIGNKYAVGNNGGRPPVYENVDQLIEACQGYFEWIKGESVEVPYSVQSDTGEIKTGTTREWVREPEKATMTGLALFLGFSHRQSLYDYEKQDEFSFPIRKARLLVEHEYELKLYGNNPTGPIFALKNMGWRDKVETGFTDNEGNDIQIIQLPHNNRDEPTNSGNTPAK